MSRLSSTASFGVISFSKGNVMSCHSPVAVSVTCEFDGSRILGLVRIVVQIVNHNIPEPVHRTHPSKPSFVAFTRKHVTNFIRQWKLLFCQIDCSKRSVYSTLHQLLQRASLRELLRPALGSCEFWYQVNGENFDVVEPSGSSLQYSDTPPDLELRFDPPILQAPPYVTRQRNPSRCGRGVCQDRLDITVDNLSFLYVALSCQEDIDVDQAHPEANNGIYTLWKPASNYNKTTCTYLHE
ncbi:hypothetical protein EDD17DRAFT_48393 [Pisolithus thermaeus]|nr:hypothetical protein EV401DRAFT_1903440 [Pisolithus croceorrhizus]KAI6166283.1 hypothetical protein EDD17DRAFT_48393 [Pisolithus thermaeus]